MGEVITTLALFIDETLVYWIPALILIGYAVKHCTEFPNEFIPLLEIGVGAVIGICFGLATSAGCAVGIANVVKFGGQGALLGVLAIALYDMVHGVIKRYLAGREAK